MITAPSLRAAWGFSIYTHFVRSFLSWTGKMGDGPEACRHTSLPLFQRPVHPPLPFLHIGELHLLLLTSCISSHDSESDTSHLTCTVSCVCSNQTPTLPRTGRIIRHHQSTHHLYGTSENVAATGIMVSPDQAARNSLGLAQAFCSAEENVRPTGAKGLPCPPELVNGWQKLLVLPLPSQPVTEFPSSSVYGSATDNLLCGKSL